MTTEDTDLDIVESPDHGSPDTELPRYALPATLTEPAAIELAALDSSEELSIERTDERQDEQPGEQQTEAAPSIPSELRVPLLQALLISFGDPLAIEQLTETTQLTADEVRAALSELRDLLALPTSGIELVEVGARFQIRTKVAFSPYIRTLKAERPRRLSGPALETLAIVAYQQPVPKSDIDKLRGVDSTPTLKTLLERGLVKVVGQAASVGHPSLYGTTEDFLKIFGLSALTDLPSLREASSLERDPGEPDEVSPDDDTELSTSEDVAAENGSEDGTQDSDNDSNARESSAEEGSVSALSRGLASRIAIERFSSEETATTSEYESSWFNTDNNETLLYRTDDAATDQPPVASSAPESAPRRMNGIVSLNASGSLFTESGHYRTRSSSTSTLFNLFCNYSPQ